MSVPAYAPAFSTLSPALQPFLQSRLDDLHLDRMTPVQASTIPLFSRNKDVVVEAVTGSGKTLAFVLPVLDRLARRIAERGEFEKGQVGAIIVSPTRELATQIHAVFQQFCRPPPPTEEEQAASDYEEPSDSEPAFSTAHDSASPLPTPLLLISTKQSTPRADIQRFLAQQTPVIVGTPGRLEEFLQSRNGKSVVRTTTLEVLVLDEADRLLDLGFQASLTRILSGLPKQRRTGLFSATLTEASSELIRMGLRNPVRIVVKASIKTLTASGAEGKGKERRTPAGLKNMFRVVPNGGKTEALIRVLDGERHRGVDEGEVGGGKFIVYMATCNQVDYFYRILSKLPQLADYTISTLHGHLPPATRTATLAKFSSHPSTSLAPSLLLCTDVASRGLDLPDVDVVIQYDPPVDPKTFAHRCGRTARAGRKGRAVVFVLEGREEDYVEFLNLRGIPLAPYPTSAHIEDAAPEASTSAAGADDTPALLKDMRAIILTDRDLHDRAAKAFTSFLRSYSKHEAGYIFPLGKLDLGGLGRDMGVVRLPGGKEVKEWRKRLEAADAKRVARAAKREAGDLVEDDDELDAERGWIWRDADVDWTTYAYASKPREAQRQGELAIPKPKVIHKHAEPSVAWSKKTEHKTEKDVRKERKLAKRAYEKAQNAPERVDGAADGESSEYASEEIEDWKELVRERKRLKTSGGRPTPAETAAAGDGKAGKAGKAGDDDDDSFDSDDDNDPGGRPTKKAAGTVGGGGISTSLDFGDL